MIISYRYGSRYEVQDIDWYSNNIRILIFKNDKLILIKEFKLEADDPFELLIYENKYSKKSYILIL